MARESFPARAARPVDAACGAGHLFPTGDLTRAAATPPARRGVSDAGLRVLGWSGRVRSGAARLVGKSERDLLDLEV